jgi:hypothetical protein
MLVALTITVAVTVAVTVAPVQRTRTGRSFGSICRRRTDRLLL